MRCTKIIYIGLIGFSGVGRIIRTTKQIQINYSERNFFHEIVVKLCHYVFLLITLKKYKWCINKVNLQVFQKTLM